MAQPLPTSPAATTRPLTLYSLDSHQNLVPSLHILQTLLDLHSLISCTYDPSGWDAFPSSLHTEVFVQMSLLSINLPEYPN
jgi:hypothetical protein